MACAPQRPRWRKAHKLRNRLPLPGLHRGAAGLGTAPPDFASIIRDEVNIKNIEVTDDVSSVGRFEVVVNARVAGPRLGKDVQKVIKAVKTGNYTVAENGAVVADGIELIDGEFSRKLVAVDPDNTTEIPGGGGLVVLDTTVTPELEAEGWAADRVRGIQDARKASGFDVSDRIALTLSVPEAQAEWAESHASTIAGEVLATSVEVVVGQELTHDVGDGCTADVAKVQ